MNFKRCPNFLPLERTCFLCHQATVFVCTYFVLLVPPPSIRLTLLFSYFEFCSTDSTYSQICCQFRKINRRRSLRRPFPNIQLQNLCFRFRFMFKMILGNTPAFISRFRKSKLDMIWGARRRRITFF